MSVGARQAVSESGGPGNYFIKAGYRPNALALTLDSVSGKAYWNETRLRRSLSLQFPVYGFAGEVISRGGVGMVIDVGCGVATKLAMLHRMHPQVEYVGIDQQSTIGFCREHHAFGRWIVDDLARPDASLEGLAGDLVICADVIEHLENPDLLLDYLMKRTRPGGRILLSTPERDLLRGRACDFSPNKYHVREWNRDELRAYLEASGLAILEHRLQLPVRAGFSRIFFSHVVKRAFAGQPVRWNQACLLRVR